MKKLFTAVTIGSLILTAALTLGWPSAGAQTTTLTLPKAGIYALTSDNRIYTYKPDLNQFVRLVRPRGVNGNLIGIDFRPADASRTSIYGLTDTGNLYLISLDSANLGTSTLVSKLSPRFAGGYQSLMDFNPVVNALRLIGSNDQNFALVNSNGGNLNVTAVQTAMAYAAGDINAGVDPNIACGAYTNNLNGAANTLFYGIDYDLDTFVTIATKSATGSSNTGGGQLQTIGNIFNANGARVNFAPDADIDIYTSPTGTNTLVGINWNILFTVDLNQLNPNLALGQTQNMTLKSIYAPAQGDGGFIDIAVTPATVQ